MGWVEVGSRGGTGAGDRELGWGMGRSGAGSGAEATRCTRCACIGETVGSRLSAALHGPFNTCRSVSCDRPPTYLSCLPVTTRVGAGRRRGPRRRGGTSGPWDDELRRTY